MIVVLGVLDHKICFINSLADGRLLTLKHKFMYKYQVVKVSPGGLFPEFMQGLLYLHEGSRI